MEETYQRLRAGWDAGNRNRESALHLLFLTWWHWAEPDFLTGLSHDPAAPKLWRDVFDHFGGEASSDAEFLFVGAIMVAITPWVFEDDGLPENRAKAMETRSLVLRPSGFQPEAFEGRGDYGEYFAHQASTPRP